LAHQFFDTLRKGRDPGMARPQQQSSPPRDAGHGDALRETPARMASLVWIGGGILVILAGWVLHAAAVVAVPIVFALLLAILLAPLDRAISERLPRGLTWLGRVAVVVVLLVALTGFFGGLVYSAQKVIDEVPRIAGNLEEFLPDQMPAMDQIQQVVENGSAAGDGTSNGDGASGAGQEQPSATASDYGAGEGDGATGDGSAGPGASPDGQAGAALRDALNRAGSTAGTWLVDAATGLAQRVAGAVGTFMAATIIVVFMVLLALGETETWQRKLENLWPRASDGWSGAFATVSRKLRGFLLVRAAMGALSAALYVGWLWLFDIGLLPVWAVLTFLLGFIPNLGSVISGILPTLYALVTKDVQTALLAGLGLFAIEQIIGNFLDPRMQGRQIAISPIVVLGSILIWGWIWGAAGALLAVPVMVGLMVACAHIPALKPLALLLSNQTDHKGLARSLET
jgi:AI-2 transport protein TqsA